MRNKLPTTKRLLICDLDNTLYDWVHYFVSSFYAMADEVVRLTGCDREQLLNDFREVHQRNHDSEHPFSLLDTATVRRLFPAATRGQRAKALDSAFHAFNSQRKKSLVLHRGVRETLGALKEADVTLVAHTESNLYAAVDRLRRLQLAEFFARIYCRERAASVHPDPEKGKSWLDDFPMERVIELSHHQEKPDPDVLLEICTAEGFGIGDSAYVGDSVARDILMAKRAGVFCVWAKYGAQHESSEYGRLVRITHWTPEDVAREKSLHREAAGVAPDYVARDSFLEVLDAIGMSRPQGMPVLQDMATARL